MLGRQEQEADGLVVRHVWQAGLQGPARRAAARGVAVEREHHGVGLPQQLLHVHRRAGRAERGHGVGKTQLGQRNDIHIAFDHQNVTGFPDRVAGLEQAIQLCALAEQGCFR